MKYRIKPGSFDRIRFRLPKTTKMHKDFEHILANFKRFYGANGLEKFKTWLKLHDLNPSKPYREHDQLGGGELSEAWRWAGSFINRYREDETGVFYRCLALTANLSMNRNDYTDVDEVSRSAASLSWRPLNLNHDKDMMLPFPQNRVDLARYEDGAVECIIRVDSEARHPETDMRIIDMISNGDIIHVSIEGMPRKIDKVGDLVKPTGITFLALALLEKDVTLPGDPLTYLEPLARR